MIDEIFAHGISRVDVIGGMVRLELFSLQPPASEGAAPQTVPTKALMLPLDGFLRAFTAQENLVQQMLKAGVLTRREDGAAAAPSQPTLP